MRLTGGVATWSVRRAAIRDRDALAELCRESVGPDDYVIDFLDWELRNHVVQVAADRNGRLVGMTVYRQCLDGSAWLAMARTHRAFRRQGVNRAIVASLVDYAREEGVPVLRLWTNAANAQGMGTFVALGFKEVARFSRFEALPLPGNTRATKRGFDEDFWRCVRDSEIVRAGNGFLPHGWSMVRADREVVSAIASQGAVRAWDENVFALSEHRRPSEGEELLVSLWAGDMTALLAEARLQAALASRPSVGLYVPHTDEFLREASAAGYTPVEWGIEAVLCELAVTRWSSGSVQAGRTRSSAPCS